MIRVEGWQKFVAVARLLRSVDDKALVKEFYAGINRSTKPLIPAVRKSALSTLPSSGGLAKRIAGSSITTQRRMSGRTAGVRLVATNGYDIGSINRGRVRHLVFGHKPWKNQAVRPNFWDRPMEDGAPAVEQALLRVMDEVSRKTQG